MGKWRKETSGIDGDGELRRTGITARATTQPWWFRQSEEIQRPVKVMDRRMRVARRVSLRRRLWTGGGWVFAESI